MRQKLLHYWFACTSSCVQATAHSFKAWLAIAAAHATSDEIPAMHWKQAGAVVAFFWILAIVDYLQDHPLPTFDTQFFPKPFEPSYTPDPNEAPLSVANKQTPSQPESHPRVTPEPPAGALISPTLNGENGKVAGAAPVVQSPSPVVSNQ